MVVILGILVFSEYYRENPLMIVVLIGVSVLSTLAAIRYLIAILRDLKELQQSGGLIPNRESLETNIPERGFELERPIEVRVIQEPERKGPPLEIPARATHFTGRENELKELKELLKPGEVVTICGPGGMGKTALAAEVAWELTAGGTKAPELFPDGVLLNDFYGDPDVTMAMEHIARRLNEEMTHTPVVAAMSALSGRQVLLILDGTEEVDHLEDLLAIRGACGVLITTRDRGDALELRIDLQPLETEKSADLLQAWGGKRADNREVACKISELVGYLPLAVRLAGSYIDQHDEESESYLGWLEESPLKALHHGDRRLNSVSLLLE